MGYSHLGHAFDTNAPPLKEHTENPEERRPNYKKIVVGDDLGSQNYLLA
jgi:hypothetical protein